MDKRLKNSLIVTAFGVILFAALMHIAELSAFLGRVFDLFLPIIAGLIIAFVMNVPMRGFEKLMGKMFKNARKKPSQKLTDGISLTLTILVVVLIIVLICTMVIPELVVSVKQAAKEIDDKIPLLIEFLQKNGIDSEFITEKLSSFNLEKIFEGLSENAGGVLSSVTDAAVGAVNGVVNAVFGIIIAVYLLLSKRELAVNCKKLINAHLKKKTADSIIKAAKAVDDTYSKFFSGQCLEAFLLAALMFIAFTIAGLPYASVVAVLTGVCSFIPYVGAFVAVAVGVVLTLFTDGIYKAIICFVVFEAVQFVENQFIYPYVVGGSVGLSPLWTLIAALMGGKLMGIVGMIFFIPLMAVISTFIEADIQRRLAKKAAAAEGADDTEIASADTPDETESSQAAVVRDIQIQNGSGRTNNSSDSRRKGKKRRR